MKRLFLATAFIFALVLPGLAMEGMGHNMEAIETKANGFDLSFGIMPHKDYQKMMNGMKMEPMKAEKGTTHHIAVTIRKDGNRVEDAAVSLKVIDPDKKEETKALTYNPDMMLQYVGHFNMQKKGKYQLQITFEAGKEKRQGIVDYVIR